MLIRITKNTGKPHIIKYIRDNGSETWMPSDDFFVRHDLSHYALESVMQYKSAFNGMLNGGMDIRDFEDREKRARLQVSAEAWYAENMANLFLIELSQRLFGDFNMVQQASFASSFGGTHPKIVLSGEQIDKTRKLLQALLQQWHELVPGDTMELIFET